LQKGIEEQLVAILIIGIVVDVLGHVGIKVLRGGGVGGIPGTSWNFAVLDTSEFIVLLPKISFQDFGRCEKPENSDIALRKSPSNLCGLRDLCAMLTSLRSFPHVTPFVLDVVDW
jgi:hypothetical protein